MSSFTLAPVLKQQFLDTNGNPIAGGSVYSYQAGTSTPQATYTDSTGGTPNANPVVLDASGRCDMWLDPSLSYKFIVKDASGNQIFSVDNIVGLLTNNSVATASIQDGAVTTPKLADGAVTGAKLASDASIDSNRPVNTNNIRDAAVTTAKIPDGAISLPKIATPVFSGSDIRNLGLSTSVSANALTIALKQEDGSTDPSASGAVRIAFRSSTATSGAYNLRDVTSALSVVVPSGASLGQVNAVAGYVYVYAIDNAGTVELAVSSSVFDDGSVQNTTALSGSSTSASVLYSTTARTGVPIRMIGRLKSTQATAGTWASAMTEVTQSFSLANSVASQMAALVRLKVTGTVSQGSTLYQFGQTIYTSPASTYTMLKFTIVDYGSGGTTDVSWGLGSVPAPTAGTAPNYNGYSGSVILQPGDSLGCNATGGNQQYHVSYSGTQFQTVTGP